MLRTAREPHTASSVLTVSTPWSGMVFRLKSIAFETVMPDRARISGTPSVGDPNTINGRSADIHLFVRSGVISRTSVPSREVDIVKSNFLLRSISGSETFPRATLNPQYMVNLLGSTISPSSSGKSLVNRIVILSEVGNFDLTRTKLRKPAWIIEDDPDCTTTPSRNRPGLGFCLSGWLGVRKGGKVPAYCRSGSILKSSLLRYCGVSM